VVYFSTTVRPPCIIIIIIILKILFFLLFSCMSSCVRVGVCSFRGLRHTYPTRQHICACNFQKKLHRHSICKKSNWKLLIWKLKLKIPFLRIRSKGTQTRPLRWAWVWFGRAFSQRLDIFLLTMSCSTSFKYFQRLFFRIVSRGMQTRPLRWACLRHGRTFLF